jgi:hypothetical protein
MTKAFVNAVTNVSSGARRVAMGATFEALAPMFLSYSLFKGDNSNVLFGFIFYIT